MGNHTNGTNINPIAIRRNQTFVSTSEFQNLLEQIPYLESKYARLLNEPRPLGG